MFSRALSDSRTLGRIFVLALTLLVTEERAFADVPALPWKLPLEVTDSTATVSFEVDSTWHLVKGTTSGLHGKVWLADPTDFLSLRGNVSLPVDRFATGGESRDTKMKEVMHADTHPEVTFQLDGVTEGGARCPVEEHECAYTASGSLTISGHTEQVKFPLRVRPTSAVYEATAELDLKWADYGVEDPSILIATLDPIVHVSVRVIIPMNSKS